MQALRESGQPVEELSEYLEVGRELGRRSAQIFGGQHPCGDCLDVELRAPLEQLFELGHARLVAGAIFAVGRFEGESAVPVKDDAHVARKILRG